MTQFREIPGIILFISWYWVKRNRILKISLYDCPSLCTKKVGCLTLNVINWEEISRNTTKPTMWLCTQWTPIRLGRSESSLCALWVAKDPSFLHADSKDSDQTRLMHTKIKFSDLSLRWVHTRFIGFVMSLLKWFHMSNTWLELKTLTRLTKLRYCKISQRSVARRLAAVMRPTYSEGMANLIRLLSKLTWIYTDCPELFVQIFKIMRFKRNRPDSEDMSCLVTKPTIWQCAQRRLRSAWASRSMGC